MIGQRRLITVLFSLAIPGMIFWLNPTFASGFQLFEQDAAGVGDYHAGGAAEADSASTAFYNPAGLVRIHNQQFSAGGVLIATNIHFDGQVTALDTNTGTANGGVFAPVPNLHFAAPFSDRWYFGMSVVAPYGLSTHYGSETIAKDYATNSDVQLIDVSPAVGYAINDHLSVGAGLDIERLSGEFDNVLFDTFPDENRAYQTRLSWHAGLLYQLSEGTRIGFAYHPKVHFNLSGMSEYYLDGELQQASLLTSNISIPPSSTLSVYHDINSRWTILGSASYTQWDVIKELCLVNVVPTGDTISLPMDYRNTWNFALGFHYRINDKWSLKFGTGYDITPTQNQYRELRLPDSNRIILAAGGHYQMDKSLGFDAGWTHLFMLKTHIDSSAYLGTDVATLGDVKSKADVLGFQVTWKL